MSEGKELKLITDDPRIKVPSDEYGRIELAKEYYQDNLPKKKYWTTEGEKSRELNSVNVLKKCSQRLAALIFNEQCNIKVNDPSLQTLLDRILRDSDFYLDFETNLEKMIALGSGVIRPYVEDDKIKLSWADATDVYPLDSNTNEVRQVALSRRIVKIEDNKPVYYTLVEFHQWGSKQEDETGEYYPYTITNELYKSTDANIVGQQMPLTAVDEFANLQPTATFNYLTKPLFAFYKNPGANNKNFVSPLGVGICDNCLNIVDAINDTHDGFVWDVKTGYRRITIPRSWVRRGEQENGRKIPENERLYWDPSDSVFLPVNTRADETSSFKDLAIEIRTQQYTDSMNFFLRELENELGLSQGTFTSTPSGVQTATEVVTNNSMTYQTRSSYLTMVEKTIDQLIYAICELLQIPDLWSNNQAQWQGDIDSLVITPDFNDGVFIDQEAQRTDDLQAVTAGILPKKQFLMRNYDLDEQTAEQWVEEANEENAPTPSADSFAPLASDYGDNGGGSNEKPEKSDVSNDDEAS